MLDLLVLLICALKMTYGQDTQPCTFNTMCSCRYKDGSSTSFIRDASCVGVPFSKFPDLPHGHISHLDLVGAGLTTVDGESMGAHIETLHLNTNNIRSLGDRAFVSTTNVLRSLDLSNNKLEEMPMNALCSLKTLNWLNLHSNSITHLENLNMEWCFIKDSLNSLFLGENDIEYLPEEQSLTDLLHLSWITLDNNKLTSLYPETFPKSLETLSVQYNYLSEFPLRLLAERNNIKRLYLRGNLIKHLPKHHFTKIRTLEKLDLSENYIEQLPSVWFNSTALVQELNLDFNKLKVLTEQSFRGLGTSRLSLANNRIKQISDQSFSGIETTLEYLDLERNRLRTLPNILSLLENLKYLYISSNLLVNHEHFTGFPNTLRALSISKNQLTEIPSGALNNCTKLSHFNIGYNLITELSYDDFSGWGDNLDTVLLQNNRIMHLGNNVFNSTLRLRELSLSFNKLMDVQPEAFTDLSTSLESLEISFGLYREDFPEDFLKPLKHLSWLALDNNNLRIISETALSNFEKLQYLNLERNRFTYLPSNLFNSTINRNLRDVRLSHNHLNKLETGTFDSLNDLRNVVLNGNNIRLVERGAFNDLLNLRTIVLSENRMNTIQLSAFQNLPNLKKIYLQNNELRELNLGVFENVTEFYPMDFNVSRNEINLFIVSENVKIKVKCLDISKNQLQEVPTGVLLFLNIWLKRLYLGYNKITQVNPSAFEQLPNLEILTLEHNSIVYLKRKAFIGMVHLQILDLSHNHIEQLQYGQFSKLGNLRILDLSFNHIKSLPRDLFQNTKLERLDLSNNEFISMPSITLGEVGFTLRYLDISYNHIEHIDSTMFQETQFLTELNLCHNKLSILPDNVFTSLGNLMKLEICHNPLRANFKELFHYIPKLRVLNVAACGLTAAPILPLPRLMELNISSNALRDVPVSFIGGFSRLRVLLLRENRLKSMSTIIWSHLPVLKHLDLSKNPLKELTRDGFLGLKRLETLILTELPHLERFDGGSLSEMRTLTSLSVQS